FSSGTPVTRRATNRLAQTGVACTKLLNAPRSVTSWPLVFARPNVEPMITHPKHTQSNTTRRGTGNLRNGKTTMNVIAANGTIHSHHCIRGRSTLSREGERLCVSQQIKKA